MKKITYKTIDEVKAAASKGAIIHWGNPSYTVKVNKWGEHNIVATNGHVAFLGKDYDARDFYSIDQ